MMMADRFLVTPVAIMLGMVLMTGCVSDCESCKQYIASADRPAMAAPQDQVAAQQEQVDSIMQRQVLDNLAMLLVNPQATPTIKIALEEKASPSNRAESTVNEVLRAYQLAGNSRVVPAKPAPPAIILKPLHDDRNLQAIEIELLHSLGMDLRNDQATAGQSVAQASATEDPKKVSPSSLMPRRYHQHKSPAPAPRKTVVIRPGSDSIARGTSRSKRFATVTEVSNQTSKTSDETDPVESATAKGWLYTGRRADVPADCLQHFGQHDDLCVWVPQNGRAHLQSLVDAVSMHATVSGEAAGQFIAMHRGTIKKDVTIETEAAQVAEVDTPVDENRPVTEAEIRDVARQVASEIAFGIREEIGSEIAQSECRVIVSEVAREFNAERTAGDLVGVKQVARDVANDIASEIRDEIGEAIPARVSQYVVEEVAREFGVIADRDRGPNEPKKIRVAAEPEAIGAGIKRMSHETSVRGTEFKRKQGFLILHR